MWKREKKNRKYINKYLISITPLTLCTMCFHDLQRMWIKLHVICWSQHPMVQLISLEKADAYHKYLEAWRLKVWYCALPLGDHNAPTSASLWLNHHLQHLSLPLLPNFYLASCPISYGPATHYHHVGTSGIGLCNSGWNFIRQGIQTWDFVGHLCGVARAKSKLRLLFLHFLSHTTSKSVYY